MEVNFCMVSVIPPCSVILKRKIHLDKLAAVLTQLVSAVQHHRNAAGKRFLHKKNVPFPSVLKSSVFALSMYSLQAAGAENNLHTVVPLLDYDNVPY